MWQGIAEQVSSSLRQPYIIRDHQPHSQTLTGRHYVVTDYEHPLFIRLAPRDQLERFTCEQHNLTSLARMAVLRVPQVVTCGLAADNAFIALEYLLLNEGDSTDWFGFGASLARLHHATDQAMYGWDEDNYLGQLRQPNRWEKRWATFFAEQRIGWQLQLLAEKRQLGDSLDINTLIDITQRRLNNHQPKSALLHGDLWRGNTSFTGHYPVLFNPCCYYGDREVDIAMTELYADYPADFYAGYQSIWPLPCGYAERRDLYQLYYRLCHYNQWGETYRPAAEAALTRFLAT